MRYLVESIWQGQSIKQAWANVLLDKKDEDVKSLCTNNCNDVNKQERKREGWEANENEREKEIE